MIETRPITATEVTAFFGAKPPFTIKGMAFYNGGKLAAIAGVKHNGKFWVAFSDIRKDVSLPAITIWRHAKLVIEEVVSKMRAPVYAIVEKNNPLGRKWAEGLGFSLYMDDGDKEIYRWLK